MNYKVKLKDITTFIFDIDGVLTDGKVAIFKDGEWVRSMSIKDGYALQHAASQGYRLAVISGGTNESIANRLRSLGVQDVFLSVRNKLEVFETLCTDYDLKPEEIAYMGDDLPDYEVLRAVGLSTCPKDAAMEIREMVNYVSPLAGGQGCARDLIEQVLRLQGKWFEAPNEHL